MKPHINKSEVAKVLSRTVKAWKRRRRRRRRNPK
jgi:hypothetical protein